MPTILFIYGWRLFFYSNESNEPIHIHVQKGDIEAKYWLLIEEIEIIEAFSYNFTPASKKVIKKIIYQHFDLIVSEWSKHFLSKTFPSTFLSKDLRQKREIVLFEQEKTFLPETS